MTTRPSYAAIAQHASFEHKRLQLSDKSIRLFQIHPGAEHEPISLRMTQFSTYGRPKYKAVSYTWGDTADIRRILVNGKAFALHVNLWQLLHHLRATGQTSFFWADALCINQFNLRERNFHVQLMGKIYEKAESVVVWLGTPSVDRTEIRAMDFVEEIAAYRKKHSDTMSIKAYFRPDLQHRWETLLRMCKPADPGAYWNRTWVIQEFLFAQAVEVFAGKRKLEWKDFEDLIEFLRREPVLGSRPVVSQILQSRTARLTLRRKAGSQSSLHELLQEYSDSACTERRDKVYGILGLASDCIEDPEPGQSRGIQPDYGKHIVDVYLEALDCIKASLPSDRVVPAAALLILQALHIRHNDLSEFIGNLSSTSAPESLPMHRLMITPEYVSPAIKIWSWRSVRDLQQKLEGEDWGQYIGYQIQKAASSTSLAPARHRLRRSSSNTKIVHSALPPDFISNMIEAANLCTDLASLHNYPGNHDLEVPLDHVPLHIQDKAEYDNTNRQKPPVILEQDPDTEVLRLGFACTNVQRGDFIIQLKGLDTTLIVRKVWHEFRLVGRAMMVKHANLEHEEPVDPICDANVWTSHCWRSRNPESVRFDTDALSLAELLMKT
ncbi:hypothetical protein OHC33_006499 [Knufia fluminis]|uniref:Heterokaryon incompatibility domain-containing protein n=1 Tax=Knufia fluminis TaxID=191047 RepID=A0AAN8ES53_9EURO|nr:hypothetical protein OHC33_006499 [Knufia fluminis]